METLSYSLGAVARSLRRLMHEFLSAKPLSYYRIPGFKDRTDFKDRKIELNEIN